MKNIIYYLFNCLLIGTLVFLSINLCAQKNYTINLNPEKQEFVGKKFYILDVIDKRTNKDFLGMVEKDGKMKPLIFKTSFEDHLQTAFSKLYPYHKDLVPVTAVVRKLRVIEYPVSRETNMEKGEIEWEVAFFYPDTLTGLFYSKKIVSYESLNVTNKHKSEIEELLKFTLLRVNEKIQKQIAHQKIDTTIHPVLTLPLQRGVYYSYLELLKGQSDSIPLTPIPQEKNIERYYFKTLKRDNDKIKKAFAVSDGTNLYLNVKSMLLRRYMEKPIRAVLGKQPMMTRHYLKAQFTGRYIYFEDRFTKGYLSYYFGLVGAVAGLKKIGIVLDTNDGRCYFLDRDFLANAFENYPDQRAFYNATEKTLTDKKNALKDFNIFLEENSTY